MMNSFIRIGLTIFIIGGMFGAAIAPPRFEIQTPRLGQPAVLLPGETLRIRLRTSLPFWHPQWQVKINRHEESLPVSILSEEAGLNAYTLDVKVPQSVKAGRYALSVSVNTVMANTVKTWPQSVYIRHQHSRKVSIVQFADLPTLGGDEAGDRQLRQIIDEINIINPDVVLLTGDMAYGGSWDQYQRLIEGLNRLDAPLIAVPGNHEYEGWAAYLALFGSPYHYVDVGDLRIISLNTGHGRDQLTQSQYRWLKQTLMTADSKTIVVQLHHPIFHRADLRGYVQGMATEMVALFKQFRVSIVLSGHWHGDAVYDEQGRERPDTWNFSGTPYVVTTTAGADLRKRYSSSVPHHGYRLIRINRGKLESYTYDDDGDGNRDPTSSIALGKISTRQTGQNRIEVTNDLNEHLTDARLKIRMQGKKQDVVTNRGELVGNYRDGEHTVYEVLVDLPARSTTSIQLQQSPIIR